MEYIDEVDENNNLTGNIFIKEKFHDTGIWYREVIGFIINEKHEILIQKRSPNKKDKPNLWEICYGHVSSRETPEQSMIRELKEEINLDYNPQDLIRISVEKTEEINSNGRYHNAFSYIYLIKTNRKIIDLKMKEDEVCDIKYIPLVKLKEIINSKENNLAFSNFDFMPKIIEKVIELDK